MRKIIRKIRDMRYQWKLFWGILNVMLIPLVLCVVLFFRTAQKDVTANLRQAKEAQLQQAVQELEGKMQIYEHITDYLFSMKEVQKVLSLGEDQLFEIYKGYTDVIDPLLQTNMYYHPEIRQMTIYLKNLDLEHGNTIAPMSSLMEKPWYQQAFPGEDVSDKWLISPENKLIYYVKPIVWYGLSKGVFVDRFDYDDFLSGIGEIQTKESESVSICAKDGTIVFSNREELLNTKYEKSDSAVISLEKPMESMDYTLISTISKDSIVSEMKKSMRNGFIIMDIVIVYILTTALLTAKMFVSRTVRLTRIVQKVGEGEKEGERALTELKGYDGPMDEMGILIKNVGWMVERLNELKIAVYNEKIARRDLEMKALQAQINPHFLYNSLSIINWKAMDADAEEVSEITLKLAEFYRTTLNKGNSIISVEGEVRNIRSYLDIQLIMHDNDFCVQWDVDEQVLKWRMPKLVLQPLVENALEHGLDLKESGQKILQIRVAKCGDDMEIEVNDNGVGMSQEKADSLIYYNSKGYGVKNVKERIALLYGEKHIFRIVSKEGEGTRIYIRIPGKGGTQ